MVNNGKLRPQRILELLCDETDVAHPLSTARIEQCLHGCRGIELQSRTTSRPWSRRVMRCRSSTPPRTGNYMFSRPYELTELKLPIDAVDSSKSFAVRKSRVLTEKLTASASCSKSGQYHRNISIAECIKGEAPDARPI